ncbi:TPA: hypothetical protein RTH14_001625 [Campylobacter jejuni]|nr:hypothetical protein [Campylobacter jejuni]HDZ5089914.1 hypothetical protein [Campylobacter jejuni]HDZ5094364.1 hypothetical protein [Campylobacter jejuni]HDZ5099442.1 hypothetical protein [Campylobacter jejuni]HDZ5102765.1 hypothetical protein [Campylobacter jejuni]
MDEIAFEECLLDLENITALLDVFVANDINDISVEVCALISKNILIVKENLKRLKLNKVH